MLGSDLVTGMIKNKAFYLKIASLLVDGLICLCRGKCHSIQSGKVTIVNLNFWSIGGVR